MLREFTVRRAALPSSAEPNLLHKILVIMTLVGGGVLVGVAAAWAATRLIASTLFGLTAMDPLTLAFAIAVMTAVALLAGYVPARRAAAVDPVIALRQD
jgi:putative ABC transport system permease protein